MPRLSTQELDELHRQAQVALLSGLRSGQDVPAILAAVAPCHQPGRFTPDVALLDLAASALAMATPDGSAPLKYEGLRERYLPEVPFVGRVEHRSSQYALFAAACMRGGLQPDLLADAGWWPRPLWGYAGYAAVIYIRAAAQRTGADVSSVATLIADRHGLGRLR